MWNIFKKSSCLHFHDRHCSCGSVRFLLSRVMFSCVLLCSYFLLCFFSPHLWLFVSPLLVSSASVSIIQLCSNCTPNPNPMVPHISSYLDSCFVLVTWSFSFLVILLVVHCPDSMSCHFWSLSHFRDTLHAAKIATKKVADIIWGNHIFSHRTGKLNPFA